ncbi:MAG: hypothetical protein A2V70_19625 [Planctomycetes bacterium RBG_13_63_9]|nr:MAG: hypothetical protein A2V70_19625 [Planctomycetes bacterium RBG_13_63_9]
MASFRGLNRRRFLRRSAALASAGAALPYFIPSGVLAASIPGGAGEPGPNDRVGVGYIAAGRRAADLMNLPKEGRMVAVSDINVKRAEAVGAKRKCRAYQDYQKMLDSQDVDAVVVSTPDHWHALPSIHACQAGKDVYCEKPMTLTIREGRLMVEAVRKYERVFQTGSQQRSMQPNRTGCQLIRNGRIGRIQKVIASNYPSPWEGNLPAQPVPAGLDWDVWCGQTEPVPYNKDLFIPRANPGWISFRPYSGGEMTGWGAHGLDQVQWALGMDESGPEEVWTEGEKFNPPTYSKAESRKRGDAMCGKPKVFFRYGGDVVMELGDGPMGGSIFVGEQGKITINRNSLKVEPEELAKEPWKDSDVRLYVSNDHMQNWIDCIKSRKRCVADVEIGHRSATVCHLGNIARWVGRRLRWDPKTETFPGDDEANGYLERPMRKPYELPDPV